MSTIESTAPDLHDTGTDHHGEGHEHPAWLAHHFDTPEQQFDSGKLGIWLFLTTEILFFGGMFCAYAIFRMLRPDVFEYSSQFLNTKLGAINTGVLLFSSLTMAWAVRCSQTEEHKKLVVMIATTLSCAMVFLGVKSIEYSHKWTMGLLPPAWYFYDESNPHPTGGPNYLLYLCLPFALITIGVMVWAVIAKLRGRQFQFEVAKPLVVVCLCFFVGVGLGAVLESGGESHAGDASHETVAAGSDHGHDAADSSHSGGSALAMASGVAKPEKSNVSTILAADATNTGIKNEMIALETQTKFADGRIVADGSESDAGIETTSVDVNSKRQAGIFFGIYYCMTGIHAIHILGGIAVLVWLLVRAVRQDFNRNYFGPVDYVGLYWHLVDLIWIYLFPLLYLIR